MSASVQPCSSAQVEVLEVLIVGADDQPVKNVVVEVLDTQKKLAVSLKTAADGLVRVEALDARDYTVRLPELDPPACELVGARALHASRRSGSAEPAWGDIADPPPTITPFQLAVPAGQIAVLRLLDVPRPFDIRFLTATGAARADVPYLALVESADGSELPLLEGRTDSDGFLRGHVPPDARAVEVTIGEGIETEVYRIALGDDTPATEPDGLRLRLEALGYYAAGIAEDEEPDIEAALKEAIAAFQEDVGLEPTGEADGGTLDLIQQIYLS